MCYVLTADCGDADGLADLRNQLLVLSPQLSDGERAELARRAWGPEEQLTDDGYTAVCWCGLETDVSLAREGEYVALSGTVPPG